MIATQNVEDNVNVVTLCKEVKGIKYPLMKVGCCLPLVPFIQSLGKMAENIASLLYHIKFTTFV